MLTADGLDPDLSQIARDLFTAYLEHYVAADQPAELRLAEYTIDAISVDEEAPYRFWFIVDFSVRPDPASAFWHAGNGTMQPNGWVEGKHLEMEVVRQGNVFTLVGGGTGGR